MTKQTSSGLMYSSMSSICFIALALIFVVLFSVLKLPPKRTTGVLSHVISSIWSFSSVLASSFGADLAFAFEMVTACIFSRRTSSMSRSPKSSAKAAFFTEYAFWLSSIILLSESCICLSSSSVRPSIFSSESCSSIEFVPYRAAPSVPCTQEIPFSRYCLSG